MNSKILYRDAIDSHLVSRALTDDDIQILAGSGFDEMVAGLKSGFELNTPESFGFMIKLCELQVVIRDDGYPDWNMNLESCNILKHVYPISQPFVIRTIQDMIKAYEHLFPVYELLLKEREYLQRGIMQHMLDHLEIYNNHYKGNK